MLGVLCMKVRRLRIFPLYTCDAYEKKADDIQCHSRASGSPGLSCIREENRENTAKCLIFIALFSDRRKNTNSPPISSSCSSVCLWRSGWSRSSWARRRGQALCVLFMRTAADVCHRSSDDADKRDQQHCPFKHCHFYPPSVPLRADRPTERSRACLLRRRSRQAKTPDF